MPGALDGLKVLDLSWGIAGALGVLFLAEQGADVIKVEPPGGDPFRDYNGYAVWNRSRRSVTIDVKKSEGLAAFYRLADEAVHKTPKQQEEVGARLNGNSHNANTNCNDGRY